jgi:Reverse transcriptase (RNA-dependent DNA polymerase)
LDLHWHTEICDLASVQVDYTNEIAQADLKEEVYIDVPKGFSYRNVDADTDLKLEKSLYGLVQAPCTFYEYLSGHLRQLQCESYSLIDSCLWINKSKRIICVIWVDGYLFLSKKILMIFQTLKDMVRLMPLTREASVNAFLGIQLQRTKNSYILTQPKLNLQDTHATHMKDCNSSCTPTPLGTDTEGENFRWDWEYASVVGMLMYLAKNSRSDIAFVLEYRVN